MTYSEKCSSSERFTLRLAKERDAEDLLGCYSDPTIQEIFSADSCTGAFRCHAPDEMNACIRFWLEERARRWVMDA